MLLDLSKTVWKLETAAPDVLPDLHEAEDVFIASDYAGQHPDKSAKYEIYSFIICDYHGSPEWKRSRLNIRERLLPGRTMSFKGLHDKVKLRALPQFLAAADQIHGVLVSIAVAKQHKSLFRTDGSIDMRIDELKPYEHWNESVFEKLLRAVHFVSFLVGALSRPGQRVLWYSDDDDIAPNAGSDDRTRTGELGTIWTIVLPNYVPHAIPQVVIGTEKDDDVTRSLSDILAIPDLACGAWCKLLALVTGDEFGHGVLVPKVLRDVSVPALRVLEWFARPDQPLRRLVCIIDAPTPERKVPHICSAPFALTNFREEVITELTRRNGG